MRFRFSVSTLVVLGFLAPLVEAQENVKPVRKEENLKSKPEGEARVYKKIDGRDLHLYTVLPAGWKPTDQRPAIVYFHGGGWEINKGGPNQFNFQSRYFASRGMVCVQVEYRLIRDNRKEAPLISCQDAKSAMRWVRSHAGEFGVDPKRIASSGGSAGGHLAAFVGMVEGTDDPQDDQNVSCRPNAMVLYNPALLAGEKTGDTKAKPSAELIATYTTISPFASVTRDDPPGLIMVGTEDMVLPPDTLKAFREKCQAEGVRMDAEIYPGEGHSFFGITRSLERFYDTTIAADRFLASLGWLQGPPTLTKDQVRAYSEELPESERSNPNKTARAAAKGQGK